MSLAANHKDEAERKLKELAEEQQLEKNIKDKISTTPITYLENVSKNINDKLKKLTEGEEKATNAALASLNS